MLQGRVRELELEHRGPRDLPTAEDTAASRRSGATAAGSAPPAPAKARIQR